MVVSLKSRPAASVQVSSASNQAGMIAAIDRVMAVIQFAPDGVILTANANFSAVMGYQLAEIRGRHHRMFVDPGYAASDDYRRFWERLRQGEFVAGEFKRLAKGGREVWMQASYNPILDPKGRVICIVKFATDITESKNRALDASGQLQAINRSQAVIEFNLSGEILSANANFCRAMGYTEDEIRGRHHRMFVEPAFAASAEYVEFWDGLRRGEYQAAEYRRIGKGGRSVWIQATYNPIFNADGAPVKVVKYATDITASVERRLHNEKLSAEIQQDLTAIAGNITNVSRQADDVASAASEASRTLHGVAAAAEELNASIGQISGNIASSKRSADEARTLTLSADGSASELARAATQMTGIIELIDAIAAQINLLALNATIESARAGEAGRGFAVVASEVKQLAAQVTSATRTISAEISGIQNVSGGVAAALKSIQAAVTTITDGIASVATAVQQQSAATAEISATMQQASSSVASIDTGVGTMAEAIASASRAAGQVRANMQKLVS